MSRAPRQMIRVLVLLTLTLSLSLFLLILSSSQQTRAADVAAFQTGADMTGTIPSPSAIITTNPVPPPPSLDEVTEPYQGLAGVKAVAAGIVQEEVPANGRSGAPVTLVAVDTATYARAAIWPPNDAVAPLMARLIDARSVAADADGMQPVPAIVDDATWDEFALSEHTPSFHLVPSHARSTPALTFLAIGRVHTIPQTQALHAGVLVDFQMLARVAAKMNPTAPRVAPNTVWLRTTDDSTLLTRIRQAVSTRLDKVVDRRLMLDSLRQQPLYRVIVGAAALGAALPLILAVGGALLASAEEMRQRTQRLALFRAIGASTAQVMRMALWEQGVIYVTAIVLSVGLGMLLGFTLTSNLLVTLLPFGAIGQDFTSASFFWYLSEPPVRIIVPSSVFWVIAIVSTLNFVGLGSITFILTRSAASQALRFDPA